MFKRGVITDEISQDLGVAIELATKYNLDGIEIRSIWEKEPHELTEEDIFSIEDMVKKAGLEICCISSPFYKCDIDDEEAVNEHIKILKQSINLAKKLKAKYVRGFTFWEKGDFSESIDKIVEKFKKPVKILEKAKDIILLLELDPNVSATNAKKLVQVIEAIDSPYVKALWDPGNDIHEPGREVPYPDGYNIIKPYIRHMHLKDAIRIGDATEGIAIGDGQVDYRGQFKALINDGYTGYVVLETHYRPKHDIKEELLSLPKGSAFSYLGHVATEECLIKWQEIMNDLGI